MIRKTKTFLKELGTELNSHILPFWINRMTDKENKGFYGRIDGHNKVDPEAGKGSVLNARILWTFSAAFNATHEEDYLNMANQAYDYCIKFFLNRQQGGVYWLLDPRGKPLEKKNQIYALAFMVYGMSEYYKATGISQAVEESVNLFHLIEKYSFDNSRNGYFEAFDENWELLQDLRLSDKDANEKKTMNTHLHILEAYTNLYRTWDDPFLLKQLKNLILLFFEKIIDPETWHFKLFFDENWNSRDSTFSFGHDIEGSWLIQEAAVASGDEKLIAQSKEVAVRMVDRIIAEGIDQDGGLFNEGRGNRIHDTDKHWWPQAEALVGLINAWEITGQQKYFDQALHVWEFIKKNIIDRKKGEWFFRVSQDGKPYVEEDKAGLWKCPYHNSRACLELIHRLK
ncbi:MAG: AGE family epimerase/isomerase [Cyclobacteriaceae bacterium]|nr:AGE family epimerase/isomerase [Cyclobacteriaceae bacterium]